MSSPPIDKNMVETKVSTLKGIFTDALHDNEEYKDKAAEVIKILDINETQETLLTSLKDNFNKNKPKAKNSGSTTMISDKKNKNITSLKDVKMIGFEAVPFATTVPPEPRPIYGPSDD